MKKKKLLSTVIATSLALTSHLYAGEKGTEIEIIPPANSWEFGISPYAWISGIKGTSGLPGLPPASIDADFGDILDNLDFAGFLLLEANKGKFRSFLDFQYVKLGADASGPAGESLNIGVEQVRMELGMGYEIYSNDATSLTAYGAVMYNYIDNSLSGSAIAGGSYSATWVDPAIGLKLSHSFSDKWSVNLTGEYGGFGVSSDSSWQALGSIGYNINDKWALLGGYRYQSIDYSKDGFTYDVDTSGPFLGARYSF